MKSKFPYTKYDNLTINIDDIKLSLLSSEFDKISLNLKNKNVLCSNLKSSTKDLILQIKELQAVVLGNEHSSSNNEQLDNLKYQYLVKYYRYYQWLEEKCFIQSIRFCLSACNPYTVSDRNIDLSKKIGEVNLKTRQLLTNIAKFGGDVITVENRIYKPSSPTFTVNYNNYKQKNSYDHNDIDNSNNNNDDSFIFHKIINHEDKYNTKINQNNQYISPVKNVIHIRTKKHQILKKFITRFIRSSAPSQQQSDTSSTHNNETNPTISSPINNRISAIKINDASSSSSPSKSSIILSPGNMIVNNIHERDNNWKHIERCTLVNDIMPVSYDQEAIDKCLYPPRPVWEKYESSPLNNICKFKMTNKLIFDNKEEDEKLKSIQNYTVIMLMS